MKKLFSVISIMNIILYCKTETLKSAFSINNLPHILPHM